MVTKHQPQAQKATLLGVLVFFATCIGCLYIAVYLANRLYLIGHYGWKRFTAESLAFVTCPKGHPWLVSNGDLLTPGFPLYLIGIAIWLPLCASLLLLLFWIIGKKRIFYVEQQMPVQALRSDPPDALLLRLVGFVLLIVALIALGSIRTWPIPIMEPLHMAFMGITGYFALRARLISVVPIFLYGLSLVLLASLSLVQNWSRLDMHDGPFASVGLRTFFFLAGTVEVFAAIQAWRIRRRLHWF